MTVESKGTRAQISPSLLKSQLIVEVGKSQVFQSCARSCAQPQQRQLPSLAGAKLVCHTQPHPINS